MFFLAQSPWVFVEGIGQEKTIKNSVRTCLDLECFVSKIKSWLLHFISPLDGNPTIIDLVVQYSDLNVKMNDQ